jgi:hypothetical protein
MPDSGLNLFVVKIDCFVDHFFNQSSELLILKYHS